MENILTERLIIRRFQPSDWLDLYEYLSDEEVVKFEPYHVYSQDASKEEALRRSKDDSFYGICLKDNQKLIGNLYLGKGEFDTWELGFVFNHSYHGKGYAFESSNAILDYAFTQLGARRIVGMCSPKNVSSWKLLEKLGFRREGHLLQNIYFKEDLNGNPIWLDTYEYAILRSEWDQAR